MTINIGMNLCIAVMVTAFFVSITIIIWRIMK